MKKCLSIILAGMLLLLSACSDASNTDRSLLVNNISFNLGASVFEKQHVYKVKDIDFIGNFSEESEDFFRSHKYVLTQYACEPGDEISINGYTDGTIEITVGEEALVLRPKAVEKRDTYVIYGYRHELKSKVELISSLDNIYNVIWECPKDLIVIKYETD